MIGDQRRGANDQPPQRLRRRRASRVYPRWVGVSLFACCLLPFAFLSQFWPAGAPIAVATDHRGRPVALRWGGVTRRVAARLARWRLDLRWWDRPVRRDYVALITHDGLLLVLFYDRLGDAWYLQRLYD